MKKAKIEQKRLFAKGFLVSAEDRTRRCREVGKAKTEQIRLFAKGYFDKANTVQKWLFG